MGGLPGGQRAFNSPSPSPERWGSGPRSSIPGLAHTIFPETFTAPSPCLSSAPGSFGTPLPCGGPRARSPPEPGRFQSPPSAAAAAAAPLPHTHHHPLSPVAGGSRSASSVLTARRSSGAWGFLGGVLFCVHGACVRARVCLCKTHIASFSLGCLRCPQEGLRISSRPGSRLFVPGLGQREVRSLAHIPRRAALRSPAPGAAVPAPESLSASSRAHAPPHRAAAVLSAGARDSDPGQRRRGENLLKRERARGTAVPSRSPRAGSHPVALARSASPGTTRPPDTHQHHGAPYGLRHALPELSRRAGLAEPLGEFAHFGHGSDGRVAGVLTARGRGGRGRCCSGCLHAGRPATSQLGGGAAPAAPPSLPPAAPPSFPPSLARSLAPCPAPRRQRRPLPPLESRSSARDQPKKEGVSGEEGWVEGEGELEGGRGSRGKRGEVATARAPPAADVAGAAASGRGDLAASFFACVCVEGWGGNETSPSVGRAPPQGSFPAPEAAVAAGGLGNSQVLPPR